ncbi:trehalase-like domain-containing protein, partial [Micromonospora sp. MH33]|uniref:trehalase-like domain-containing protein n=1 Tax=Micromonospora sp. MH33 TaxID=1945509 RepID=UPI001FEEE56D
MPGHDADPQTTPSVLRDYALLADGYRGALVGPGGDVAWLCAPGWSDAAVFSALLGGAGRFLVTPAAGR